MVEESRIMPVGRELPSVRRSTKIIERFWRTSGRTWEFPFEFRKYFSLAGQGGILPFVGFGLVARHSSGESDLEGERIAGDPPNRSVGEWDRGLSAIVGIRGGLAGLGIGPELRYARWSGEPFRLNDVIRPNRNTLDFVVRVTLAAGP